jgi:hypothetical protein
MRGGGVHVEMGMTKGRRSSFEIVRSKSRINFEKRHGRNGGQHTQRSGAWAYNKIELSKKKNGGKSGRKGGEKKKLTTLVADVTPPAR